MGGACEVIFFEALAGQRVFPTFIVTSTKARWFLYNSKGRFVLLGLI